MATQNYLAVDLGAESGRGVVASFDGTRLSLRELRRFPTTRGAADMGADGVRRWDFERLWSEIQATLSQALAEVGTLAGVGVDSWGVDFGLLDTQGQLLEAPVHYRDASHPQAMRRTLAVLPAEDLWDATGIQILPFNTLFQLLARQERDPELLKRADPLLLMPDLLHSRLTAGRANVVEFTNASTTQCLSAVTKTWDTQLLERLGLLTQFLGPLTTAGSRIGETPEGVPVYAPGTHDTASAAVPAKDGTRWAFLSSGTWSLLGAELAAPVLSRAALHAGFSNEGGVGGTTRFLQNIMGLWLVQECRRSLVRREGHEYGYPELAALAEVAPANGPIIDATDNRFLAPTDMIEELQAACRDTNQTAPTEIGAIIRCCLDSLALAYRRGLANMEAILGQWFDMIHVVGRGAQNRLLNQLTADACGRPVVAGPGEATALGNAIGQLVAAGAVANWSEARQVARRSSPTETYAPQPDAVARWQDRAESLR